MILYSNKVPFSLEDLLCALLTVHYHSLLTAKQPVFSLYSMHTSIFLSQMSLLDLPDELLVQVCCFLFLHRDVLIQILSKVEHTVCWSVSRACRRMRGLCDRHDLMKWFFSFFKQFSIPWLAKRSQSRKVLNCEAITEFRCTFVSTSRARLGVNFH